MIQPENHQDKAQFAAMWWNVFAARLVAKMFCQILSPHCYICHDGSQSLREHNVAEQDSGEK